MDNISRRLSTEDTATSMYLSFDAESTMSTACYKTLEAMSDISSLSAIDMEESVNKSKTGDMNSTLEARNDSQTLSPLKTVKKMEMPVKLHTPLKALPKNILKEYKALCSTPSKEQLLKTVDVTRGSDATRCVDLGLAFLGVEDEKPAYFPPPPVEINEENKENALPETDEVSTLSTCSSVEITATSVIERKMLTSVSTVGSITEEESLEEVKIMKHVEEILVSADHKKLVSNKSLLEDKENNDVLHFNEQNLETTPKVKVENMDAADIKEVVNTEEFGIQNVETTPKAKAGNIEHMDTISEDTPVIKESDDEKKAPVKKSSSKPKIAVLARNGRRSVCEPNLQANKPSRIFNSVNKRQSLLPTSRKSTMPMDVEIEIPMLMDKILKITNSPTKTEKVGAKETHQLITDQNKSTPAEKRRSIMASMKTRSSLIPSAAGDKRPFSFTQRMSVVVKTTLNSPARKIARKSSMGGIMTSLQRRSVIPQKVSTIENSKIKKPEINARRSMLSKTTAVPTISKSKHLVPLEENSVKPSTIPQRQSLYSSAKNLERAKMNSIGGLTHNKPDITYTCNICKEKFRIKSLLDAHKRSHESDNATPAFIKKPTPVLLHSSGSSTVANSNQCKYCDKKFALTRALHIHLLQNCLKIPPSEKRKLQYTDLNHVEKAQLPNVFAHHNSQSSASSTVSSTNATPRHALKPNTLSFPKSSSESLNENKDKQKNASDLLTVDGNNTAISGSVQKIKKVSAHAGVYRTPSKSVPCHLCKLTFKSILDYTNHNLTTHGSNKTNITEDMDNEIVVEENVTTNN
ncbi:uncharacterized protein LOC119604277 isoform X2 [Lucilia sericata]|uniref:uncharacterized protein LOC119604277 isoform X2 n=1 Tax=Lucilia sericata TaxID=13632 RepID=UPI0018A7F1D4|nr:uncharacterized protein LOC119604277 isoform X2 [Lucilia sericata]